MADQGNEVAETYQNKEDDILICLPGDRLCRVEDNVIVGEGTYEQAGYIYASKSGIVNIDESTETVYCFHYYLNFDLYVFDSSAKL